MQKIFLKLQNFENIGQKNEKISLQMRKLVVQCS